ncbi:hypothetical protein A3K86_20140 [Photobacterium jeanii]|uniref:Porin n=1 Tax=Photobacterium jeanii TaxID=858640 RepID=A0A178K1S0_9GAMM|nr:hypothetical protein [Photobacterium jeanii]OAN11268.1 hypothetical protein A3K86_20140 [Photobacterium jeanii]PST90788.1 hypothetical protein C9I91_09250 [Photobacterium jeanii]
MKKLLSLAIAIAVSAPAMADVYTDVNYKHSKDVREAAAKVGYEMDNGLSFDLENVYDVKNKENKEVTLGTAWKFEVAEGAYVQPLAEVTFSTYKTATANDTTGDYRPSITEHSAKYDIGNTYKMGIKGGYKHESGLYVDARYRYETRKDKAEYLAKKNSGIPAVEYEFYKADFKDSVHRTDLTLGYDIQDVANLSVNWVRKAHTIKIDGTEQINGSFPKAVDGGKGNFTSNDYEFRADVTALGDFVPYAQYTIKSDIKKDGHKLKRENEIKVGLVYNF